MPAYNSDTSSDKQKEQKTHSAEASGVRLNVTISRTKQRERPDLLQKLNVDNYDLLQGATFSEKIKALTPRGTPEYIDRGEKYVERIMRALYHFKQCALIGPSGTGKSICEKESVFVLIDGRPTLTTVDALFEKLARKIPATIDQEGWETVVLDGTDIRVLSMDRSSNKVNWKRPIALARSMHHGKVVEVRTQRNRLIRATPEHSFITEDSLDKLKRGKQIKVGTRIPIIRHIPQLETPELSEISLTDYVPGTKATERCVVRAGNYETIQVPAPMMVQLDEDFSWFLGFFVAEGYVGKGFASIRNFETALIEKSKHVLESLNLRLAIRKQRELCEIRLFGQAFVSFLSATTLTRRVGSGKRTQARYKRVPDFVYLMQEQSKIAFLRGFFDGDGWEEKGSNIVFCTSSEDLANGLIILLEQLQIFPTIRTRTTKGVRSFSVGIARDGASRLGLRISGLERNTDLRGHVEKIRITPQMIRLAKKAYHRLPEESRSKNLSKRLLGNFYDSEYMGLQTLAKIADELRSPELLRMAETDILWDSVKAVKEFEYDGWVYDFQVPGTETFASGFGGVLTHNTHIVYLVAELAGLPMWEINCGLQTSAYDLFGRYVGLGKENWIDGQIVSWCRHGGILYLDEANMMKQDVATRLNPVLDTRGHLVLTEKDNEIIPRHPAGYVVISMNPYSAEFAGTKPLNAAFRRRMSVWIDFDYLSVGNKISDDEITLVEKKGKIERDIATNIVRVGAELRRQYKANEIPYGPSVGDLINWALLVSDGVPAETAAEETVISMTSDNAEVQDMVRRVVRMIFGGATNAIPETESKAEAAEEQKEIIAPTVVNRPRAPMSGGGGDNIFSDSFDSDSSF
jgi:intein/homing endonuclease/MoxR-like ATPase